MSVGVTPCSKRIIEITCNRFTIVLLVGSYCISTQQELHKYRSLRHHETSTEDAVVRSSGGHRFHHRGKSGQ